MTPHFIGRALKAEDGLESVPSTGAVNSVLSRWEECGYANMTSKPYGFKDYTPAAFSEGLASLKAKHAAAKKASRKAARDAVAAASAAANVA